MDLLHGKVALVTGASRGIGRAIANGLAAAGVNVAINFRERELEAHQVHSELDRLGVRSIAIQADVSVAADVERLIGRISAELGPVDILVNNAGIARAQRAEQVSEQDWDELLTST